MTNINCSSTCAYQKDGKCTLDDTTSSCATPSFNCAYYSNEKKMK